MLPLRNLGFTLSNLGKYEEAEAVIQRCLNKAETVYGSTHPISALFRHEMATVAAYTDRWERAAGLVDKSLRDLMPFLSRVAGGLPESEQMSWLSQVMEWAGGPSLSIGLARRDDPKMVELSAGWLLNTKAILYELMAERALLSRDARLTGMSSTVAEIRELRRQIAELVNAQAGKGSDEERRRELTLLDEKEEALSRRIGEAGGRFYEPRRWIDVSVVRNALPAEAIFIDLARIDLVDFTVKGSPQGHVSTPHYLAWVIPPAGNGEVHLVDLGLVAGVEPGMKKLSDNREKLTQAREEFNKNVASLSAEKLSEDVFATRADALFKALLATEHDLERSYRAEAARELSTALLHPLLPHLGKAKHLVLSPDADLWLVPWAALLLADNKQSYLLERFSLSFAVSGRDLLPGRARQIVRLDPPLVISSPNYDLGVTGSETRAHNVKLLNGFGRDWVRKLRPNLEILAGAEADVRVGDTAREEVIKATRSPSVLLLVTHASFGEIDPLKIRPGFGFLMENPLLRCQLTFAGCNRKRLPGDEDEDGFLFGVEVLGCDLRGTKLVMLTACETARGDVHAGQSAAGMRQAFQLAGARAVVATLWSVDQRASRLLTEDVFAELAAGRPIERALREAQLRRAHDPETSHPFYWAAFTLTDRS